MHFVCISKKFFFFFFFFFFKCSLSSSQRGGLILFLFSFIVIVKLFHSCELFIKNSNSVGMFVRVCPIWRGSAVNRKSLSIVLTIHGNTDHRIYIVTMVSEVGYEPTTAKAIKNRTWRIHCHDGNTVAHFSLR